MSEAGTIRATQLKAACALMACCAIAIFAFRSLAGALWRGVARHFVKNQSFPDTEVAFPVVI
jgi:hypothetical protein